MCPRHEGAGSLRERLVGAEQWRNLGFRNWHLAIRVRCSPCRSELHMAGLQPARSPALPLGQDGKAAPLEASVL